MIVELISPRRYSHLSHADVFLVSQGRNSSSSISLATTYRDVRRYRFRLREFVRLIANTQMFHNTRTGRAERFTMRSGYSSLAYSVHPNYQEGLNCSSFDLWTLRSTNSLRTIIQSRAHTWHLPYSQNISLDCRLVGILTRPRIIVLRRGNRVRAMFV